MSATFKAMTYNVAGQDWMGFPDRANEAGIMFGQQDCDVVGFQELGILNWKNVFSKVRQDLKIVDGVVAGDIVINSCGYRPIRFDLVSHRSFWLSDDGTFKRAWEGAERGATAWVGRCGITGAEILFINAHLDNKSPLARLRATELIIEFARKMGYRRVVLTMDSNMSPHSPRQDLWGVPEMQLPYKLYLDDGFIDCATYGALAGKQREGTFHALKGDEYVVDEWGTWDTEMILVKGLEPISYQVLKGQINGKFQSDHYPTVAEIRIV